MKYASQRVAYWYFVCAMILFGVQIAAGALAGTVYVLPNTLSELMKVTPFDRFGTPSEIASRHFGGMRGLRDAVSGLQAALYQ